MQFLVALFLLGVGWNFLFTGGTTLLTTTYRPEEKTAVLSVKPGMPSISLSTRPESLKLSV
jgi:fucose permease